MPAVEIVAVNQCSGNRRGLFQPHVAGVEWGYGAMGCARWKGARLKDMLDKVGLKKEAIEIVFDGADGPVVDKTPDFVKSIPVWKAMEETTLIAYEMNGAAAAALQRLSGAHHRAGLDRHLLDEARHLDQGGDQAGFDGFWMKPAYRIPLGKFPLVARFTSQETAVNTPITEMVVNSLITSHADGAAREGGHGHCRRHRLGRRLRHSRGRGLDRRRQDLGPATLGEDLGRFAFRHLELTRSRPSAASTRSWRARPTPSARPRPPA